MTVRGRGALKLPERLLPAISGAKTSTTSDDYVMHHDSVDDSQKKHVLPALPVRDLLLDGSKLRRQNWHTKDATTIQWNTVLSSHIKHSTTDTLHFIPFHYYDGNCKTQAECCIRAIDAPRATSYMFWRRQRAFIQGSRMPLLLIGGQVTGFTVSATTIPHNWRKRDSIGSGPHAESFTLQRGSSPHAREAEFIIPRIPQRDVPS